MNGFLKIASGVQKECPLERVCGVDIDALSEHGDLVITISKGHCFNLLDFFACIH